MTDKERLAVRINELFHDIEGKEYQKKHTDIFKGESFRWQNAAKQYFREYNSPVVILDIGTGTGFVPLSTASYLTAEDTFICSDISKEMLKVSEKNLKVENFDCKFEFLKLNGDKLNIADNSISIVAMNSVLHHIPNIELFCEQLNKIIQVGGRIIVGHEPNKRFYENKFLVNLFLVLQAFSSLKKLVLALARLTHLSILIKKFVKTKEGKYVKLINQSLIEEGFIKNALTRDEINKIVDYHSPSAGAKIDKSKGIDIEKLQKQYLFDFSIEFLETYNFISKLSNRNSLLKKVNNLLKGKYIGCGATFFVVLKREK